MTTTPGPGRHDRHRTDHADHAGVEEHDLGLSHDLPRLVDRQRSSMGRRGLLGLFGGVGAAALVACGTDTASTTSTAASAGGPPDGMPPGGGPGGPGGGPGGAMGGDTSVAVADGEIPEETAGPYPGDGSNGPNVLAESGVVRSDMTSSFGDATGVAEGVPTTVRMKVYDLTGDDVEILQGAAVYLWHCDRDGRYSMYDEEVAEENYLRAVQATDADGWVEFTTILPGAYAGRWPHMHFEVYASLDDATTYSNKLRTSQLAIPEATCREVYGVVEGYETSLTNLDGTSLETDGIFSDGYSLQLAKAAGSATDGYTLTLNVPI